MSEEKARSPVWYVVYAVRDYEKSMSSLSSTVVVGAHPFVWVADLNSKGRARTRFRYDLISWRELTDEEVAIWREVNGEEET